MPRVAHGKFVELDDLSWEEILKLPRAAFEPEEFDSLTEDEQETVRDNDEASQARMQKLIKLFTEPYDWVTDNEDEDYIFEMVGTDGFENYLLENADHLIEIAKRRDRDAVDVLNEIVEANEEDGFSRDQVIEAIEKAMGDYDAYDRSLSDEYTVAFYKDGRREDQIEVGSHELKEALEGMYWDEVDAAAEEIDRLTNGVFRKYARRGLVNRLTGRDIAEAAKAYGFTANISVDWFVDWDPDWDQVRTKVAEILEEMEPEEEESDEARAAREAREARTLEERKVMKFKDGFYWLELTPDDLRAEGARTEGGLHHCIGKTEAEGGYGYPEALKRGKGRAFSLRTPAGKRKITLWADVQSAPGREPLVRGITQVKGKLNRLVGWDLNDAGGKNFKEDEVKKTIEFIANYLEFPPQAVNDLRPALKYMDQDPKLGPWLDRTIQGRAERAEEGDDEPEENPAAVCPDCGGPATGFCAPPAVVNPSTTVVYRKRGESVRAFEKRVISYMKETDYADVADDNMSATIYWFGAEKEDFSTARALGRRRK